MKTKKHPKANLENYSKLFAQLGLVLSLVIVYVLIQSKTFNSELAILGSSKLNIQSLKFKKLHYDGPHIFAILFKAIKINTQ